MSPVVKKILVISMLFLIAAPFLFSAAFLIEQQLIKSRMKERIEQSAVQTIVLKNTDINWVEKDEEALIDNKLFDVKSFTIKNDKISLTGLFDEDEDALVAKMKNQFQQKKETSNLLHLLVSKFITQQVLSNPEATFSIQNGWKIVAQNYRSFSQRIPETNFRIAIPPPKFS